jgi:hypothetical protein
MIGKTLRDPEVQGNNMNLQDMKLLKERLIIQGVGAYHTIANIVDTLGESKRLAGRNYQILEHDGITLLHLRNISKAKIGNHQSFQGWLYRDTLFVTVGDPVPLCPFRSDRVMYIAIDNETTEVTQQDIDNEIFVPYHMDWYNRILALLPKAKAILAEASKGSSEIEKEKLSKSLFLDQNKNILGVQK